MFVKTIKDRIVTQIICGDTMEINSKSVIKHDWIILAKKRRRWRFHLSQPWDLGAVGDLLKISVKKIFFV